MSRGFETRRGNGSKSRTTSAPLSPQVTAAANNVFGRNQPMSESNGPGANTPGANSPDGDRSTSDRSSAAAGRSREEHLQWVLQQVRQALTGMKFGQITITVQDGLAIQIERTEKTRLR